MKRASTLLAFVVVALVAGVGAEGQGAYTRFLVPLYVSDTPGAYGSLWQVRTWIHYRGSSDIAIVPAPYCFGVPCGGSGKLFPYWPVVPLQRLGGFPEPAILVHVESAGANDVRFSSRVRDLSRASDSAGTEIPVVREDRMPAAAISLVNVPVERRFRSMLRLYALPDVNMPEVEVRYYRQPLSEGPGVSFDPRLLKVQRVSLRRSEFGVGLNLAPALAEIGSVELIPELNNETSVWIEVVPLTPGMRIWALASVTHNATQQVTIISPNE